MPRSAAEVGNSFFGFLGWLWIVEAAWHRLCVHADCPQKLLEKESLAYLFSKHRVSGTAGDGVWWQSELLFMTWLGFFHLVLLIFD